MTSVTGHFAAHLQELRRRVLLSFLAVIVCSAAAYIFAEELTRFFMEPLLLGYPELAGLVYTNLTEAFVSYLKVALLVGLIFSFPVLCYEVWMFISPGLHKQERRTARLVALAATFLFAAGVVFAYLVVLPTALSFLMGFASDQLEPLPKLDSYLTFVARTSLTFGLAFEIPFLMAMAARTGLARPGYFSRQRKYYYLAILVLAFLLGVGDVFSALLLAVPLFGLYEAGLVITRLFSPPA